MIASRLLGSFGIAALIGFACGGNDGEPEPSISEDAACDMIVEACHYKDDGTDPMINDYCHLTAHSGGPCNDRLQECLEYCGAAPAVTTAADDGDTSTPGDDDGSADDGAATTGGADDGPPSGSSGGTDTNAATDEGPAESSGDAGGESTTGASPECAAHCACMTEWCAGAAGNPWPDETSCLTACAAWDGAELACYGMWCEEIESNPGLADHLCEHAWGEFGLAEC